MKCSFCGAVFQKGTGMMYVKRDAKILYFCSRKCEKNMIQLKRKPLNVRWTEAARRKKEGIERVVVKKKQVVRKEETKKKPKKAAKKKKPAKKKSTSKKPTKKRSKK